MDHPARDAIVRGRPLMMAAQSGRPSRTGRGHPSRRWGSRRFSERERRFPAHRTRRASCPGPSVNTGMCRVPRGLRLGLSPPPPAGGQVGLLRGCSWPGPAGPRWRPAGPPLAPRWPPAPLWRVVPVSALGPQKLLGTETAFGSGPDSRRPHQGWPRGPSTGVTPATCDRSPGRHCPALSAAR